MVNKQTEQAESQKDEAMQILPRMTNEYTR